MDPNKRSSIVLLTVVGASVGVGGLASAFPGQEMHRNLYPDRAGCERDYSPQQCQPGSGSASVGVWHGPYYYANRTTSGALSDPGPGRTGQVTATETSMRGGFGHFGHGMRAGG